ncbi:MAG: exopolysaccharide Pel transporter PelG [Bacillota bacterium]
MAGIGFELRKVFSKQSVFSKVKGIVFATMTTIGPTIIFLILLLGIHFAIDRLGVSEIDRNVFSSALLYVFISAIIISSALNTISSRFTSDMLFENKEEYVPSALFGSMFIAAIASVFWGLFISLTLFFFYQHSLLFVSGLFIFCVMIAISYTIMTYVSTIKEYAKITKAFALGIALSFGVYFLLHLICNFSIIDSIIWAMAVGFLLINIIIVYYIISFFNYSNEKYFAFLAYFKKHPKLFFSGLFYILGLYVANILYWFFSVINTKIEMFYVAPLYDMASFLAILANLSAVVIFTVKIETNFFEKYQKYVASLANASYATIEKTRKIMQNTLQVQLFFIYEVQLIIEIILSCLAIYFLPRLGLGGSLDFFLILGLAVFCIFSMYFTVVFMYYFDDQFGAVVTTAIFFFLTTLSAIFILIFLGRDYYAVAPLIGSVFAWLFAFFRLRYFVENINAQLFCRKT